MWKLKRLYATNIVSFKEIDTNFASDVATLVFGNNLDNENQKNNGSGKSSIIEAIAFGLTGDTLRKVDTGEIINDAADAACVKLSFANDYDESSFVIERTISRNAAQEISCHKYDKDGNEIDTEKTIQPTVNDYNRFILEEIGLTKDDIYSCFILCQEKYKSFLDASDKSKKELINRFSNGVLVDKSIEALKEDMAPVKSLLGERENNVSKLSGKIEALEEQIARAEETKKTAQLSKEQRIAQVKKDIEESRAQLRELKETVKKANDRLDLIYSYADDLEDIEDSDDSLIDKYIIIRDKFLKLGIPMISDYEEKCKEHQEKLKEAEKQMPPIKKDIELAKKESNKAFCDLAKKKAEYEEKKAGFSKDNEEGKVKIANIESKISKLDVALDKTRNEIKEVQDDYNELDKDLVRLMNLIRGKITCPKCGHEFILDKEGKTLDDLKGEAEDCEYDMNHCKKSLDDLNKEYNDKEEQRHSNEEAIKKLNDQLSRKRSELSAIGAEMQEFQDIANKADERLSSLKSRLDKLQNTVSCSNDFMTNMGKAMFDEAFNAIDARLDAGEQFVKDKEAEIERKKAQISQYETSLEEIENSSTGDITESLVKSKEEYTKQYEAAVAERDQTKAEYSRLELQEQQFIDFKSYLANQKIDSISAITNSFLDKIGSDIRVEMEGYKKLKSGKIRDKITVKILRNGVECGSFAKFSRGEKARVCLANILAMWHLTNAACENGRGLGVLIIDEVLDSSDTSGIMSYCEAINAIGITTLLVTQGAVVESYPHRLLVTKQNGVSKIS